MKCKYVSELAVSSQIMLPKNPLARMDSLLALCTPCTSSSTEPHASSQERNDEELKRNHAKQDNRPRESVQLK